MSRSLIKRGENKGFTLMEVLIAIVVLSVALLALAGLQIISIQGNSFGNRMTEAMTLAKDLMEERKNTEWEHIGEASDNHQGDSGITYHWACSVTQSGKMKTVTVTVTWENGIHSVALVTKIPDLRASP
jgi:prepilin-type N-terminal cleavage/methylation domain-containing protein